MLILYPVFFSFLDKIPVGGPGVKGKITSTAGIKRHQASTPSSEPESKKVTAAKDVSTKIQIQCTPVI